MKVKKEVPIITVIVPIYNTEEFLQQCLSSIALQTYKNLDVVLIDDGSTDSCGTICDEWCFKDKRFRVLHKQNGGIASARNAGLELRQGEYVTWVDSDDWIDATYIEELYTKLIENKADMAINCHGDGFNGTEKLFNCDILKHYLMGELTSVLWQTMAKSSFFNNKFFSNYRIGEDSDMLFRLYQDCQKIIRYQKEGYHWRIHQNSTTHSLDYDKILAWFRFSQNEVNDIKEKQPELRPYYSYKQIYIGSLLYRNLRLLERTRETKLLKKELRKDILNAIKYIAYGELNKQQFKEVLGAIKVVLFK